MTLDYIIYGVGMLALLIYVLILRFMNPSSGTLTGARGPN